MNSILATLLITFPTIVCYGVRNPILKNYNIRKDFKLRNVKTNVLPTEVLRDFEVSESYEILEGIYGSLISNFEQTLKKNFNEKDMGFFYNNLKTLNVNANNNLVSTNEKVVGTYSVESNVIKFKKKHDYESIIGHELFHCASTFTNSKHYTFSGFSQSYKSKMYIGKGLDEGYTELLTRRYFPRKPNTLICYKNEVIVAEIIESIVGKEKMQSLYLNADLKGLIDVLNQYNVEENVHYFLKSLDFTCLHFNNKHLTDKTNKLISNSYEDVATFIIQTYINKLIFDSFGERNNLAEFLYSELEPVVAKLKNIKGLDEKLLSRIIIDCMSGYNIMKSKKFGFN